METAGRHVKDFEVGYSAGSLAPGMGVGDAVRVPVGRLCFIMVTGGEGMVEVDGLCYDVGEGSFIYVLPQHLVVLRSCSAGFATAYACFTFELLSDFPLLLKADISDYAAGHPCCRLDGEDYAALVKYYELVAGRSRSAVAGLDVLKGLMFSFVVEVNRIYSSRSTGVSVTRRDKLADAFFKLLHAHFAEERSAAFYARELCVSDKHLMRVIKQATGRTFHFWLTDFLLRRARLLLLSTDMTVTQVAAHLCFPDSSAFARFFRKGTGLSPLEYRARRTGMEEAEVIRK